MNKKERSVLREALSEAIMIRDDYNELARAFIFLAEVVNDLVNPKD